MRSMRRGIKEMDILLTAYADANLPTMDAAKLDLYDQLLHENDQDLLQWVTGQVASPTPYEALIQEVVQSHQTK
jgi:antitoxin CptB